MLQTWYICSHDSPLKKTVSFHVHFADEVLWKPKVFENLDLTAIQVAKSHSGI